MNQHIDNLQAVVLAFIQGLTEFLPISSSGHLVLIPMLSNWPDQGLAFDCVVHLGTLTAVVAYFRSELRAMTTGFMQTVAHRSWEANSEGKLAWLILLATIPVGVVGLLLKDFIEMELRSAYVIAVASIVFGLLLWVADKRNRPRKHDHSWSLQDALIVGMGQAVALIPGTSRSGITITMALLLGYDRESAARFSFLLSIPVIVLAGGLNIIDLIENPDKSIGIAQLGIGFVTSVVVAYACIFGFLKFIERIGMGPFVVYRIALGIVLLMLA